MFICVKAQTPACVTIGRGWHLGGVSNFLALQYNIVIYKV